MGFAIRLRRLIVHGIFIGALALTVVVGLGSRDASAAKSVAVSCDSLMAAAMYAAGQSSAADRGGDTIASDWWSIYVSYESAYVKSGCLDDTTA